MEAQLHTAEIADVGIGEKIHQAHSYVPPLCENWGELFPDGGKKIFKSVMSKG